MEYVKAVQSVDADTGFTFVLNMREETPQDWADLAEFLTGDGTNPNGGENWAQMRIDSGIEKPVNVEVWEFGNEMDWGSAENVFSPEKYVNLCHQGIEAIRTVDPDAVFAAQSATDPWNEGDRTPDWRTWNRTVLEGLKDDIDYLTLHAYYYGMSLDEIEDDYLDVISSDIREVTGDNRIKIYISEHAIWPSDTESRESYTETTNLQSMLGVCEFFSRMMQREDVELASYHCLTGLWAFVRQRDGEFYATTMPMLFKLYNEMLGDNVVKVTQSGELAEGDNTNFVTNAMTTDKGLNLIISNRTNDMKRQASFVFNGQYKVSKIHTITSENSWLDDNVPGSTPVTLTTVENASDEIFTGCLVPERSIIAIELEKIEPKTFSDIAGHWAEASIAMLASKGSLFWIENSKFLPEQNITRAEFAAIVADVMELPQNETPTFEDVTADKWYYGDVNAVADAEYINGVSETAFEPEQLLTRQEIAVITARILTSLEKDYSSVQLSYPDAEDIEAWAAEGVTTAVAAGLMQGDEEGFRPFDHLTRAEAVVIAVRMLDKI